MYVVLIRTAGNQRYIFSSGKRKEIAGASELIARVNNSWVWDALREEFPGFSRDWRIGAAAAELVVAGAGRIVVLVDDPARGRKLVTRVTTRALCEAPGLDVCGVVVECQPGSLSETIREAERKLQEVREARPGPEIRFPRLPLVEDCASNGLPATEIRPEGKNEPPQARSPVAVAKLNAYESALVRLAQTAGSDRRTMQCIVDRLGLMAEWVAVVHADGNSLGEVFRSLSARAGGLDDADYADMYRDVSAGVDECAEKAFRIALDRIRGGSEEQPPVLPLVLGGDDLTVVCEGEVALPFARHYLEAFEEETARNPLIQKSGYPGLQAAAGVAIVKRNYPFHFAYHLAERLVAEEAKSVKEFGSALAFVVLMESAAPDLKRLRGEGSARSASPYLVGKGSGQGESWEDLERRVAALGRRDPLSGEALIPRGAVHELREGLGLGDEVAAARLEMLRRRFAGEPERRRALDDLTDGVTSDDLTDDALRGLPDAMAAFPFLRVEEAARSTEEAVG